MKNILGIGLLAVLLSACGGGGYERYEGYWQRQDENKRPSVARITKQDNKTYLINKNVMPDENGKVWGEDTVLTQKDDGTMAVDTGFGSIPLVLSEDGKTLYIKKDVLVKISEDEFKAIIQKAEQDSQRCKQLEQDYKEEFKTLDAIEDREQRKTAMKAAQEKYRAQEKEIPACHIGILQSVIL